ncbi:hypothetical protein QVD17_31877 [Tagetes erecta]|uniref:Uncharacterized protein n=1 Tax=Tagetes erecta TaxID=13708 RepID=A0AAD8NNZ5_TARER|nr:hypothetical protein QVD17_31877 [Tagetes erecta]
MPKPTNTTLFLYKTLKHLIQKLFSSLQHSFLKFLPSIAHLQVWDLRSEVISNSGVFAVQIRIFKMLLNLESCYALLVIIIP